MPSVFSPGSSFCGQTHEQSSTRPAERPAGSGDLLRQTREPDGEDYEQGRDTREGSRLDVLRRGQAGESCTGGGTSPRGGGIPRQWVYDAVAEKIAATAPEGARAEDIRDDAIVSTAQLNAVSAGRKPSFLEPDIRRMRRLCTGFPNQPRLFQALVYNLYHDKIAALCVFYTKGALNASLNKKSVVQARFHRDLIMPLGCGRLCPMRSPARLSRTQRKEKK